MYLSTSMFDNAVIFRGSFQSLRGEYRHTNGVLLLWKKKYIARFSQKTSWWCVTTDCKPLVCNSVMEQWWKNSFRQQRQHSWTEHKRRPSTVSSTAAQQQSRWQQQSWTLQHTTVITTSTRCSYAWWSSHAASRLTTWWWWPFHTPFQSPPRPNDDSPDEEMHSPQDEPPDLPPYPSSPPDHPQPPLPGAQAIPVSPDTVIVPNTIIPPNIEDTPMTHSINDHLMIHRYHLQLRLDHLDKCLLRLQPNFSLVTIWGVIHSHLSHQTLPHNPL